MKTYSESKGKAPIDWNARLNQEVITDREWCKWYKDSASWVTCACGNLCDVIPRYLDVPKDKLLYTLGVTFTVSIDNKNIEQAKSTLHKIELRSVELIAEINKKTEINALPS